VFVKNFSIRVIRLGALATAAIAMTSCAGVVPPFSPEANGSTSQSTAFGAKVQHLGDVVRVLKSSGQYPSLAWDPVDHVLIGSGNGDVKILIGARVKLPRPGAATGVAYDAGSRTFYFASGNTLLSSKVKGTGVTTLTSALGNAGALAVGGAGDVYVIDGDHIDRLRGKSLTIAALPGTVTPAQGDAGPPSIAYDSANKSLYLSDASGDVIKRILPNKKAVVVAGHCILAAQVQGCESGNAPGTGQSVLFGSIGGIVYDPKHDYFIVADKYNNQLWRVTASGEAEPVAGYGPYGATNGNGWQAFLSNPQGVAYAPDKGVIFESEYSRIASYAVTGAAAKPLTPPTTRFVVSTPTTMVGAPLPDGSNAYFVLNGTTLDHITSDGTLTSKTLPVAGVRDTVVKDRFGNLWMSYLNGIAEGMSPGLLEIEPSGAFQTFTIADAGTNLLALTIGPDGNPWFATNGISGSAIATVANGTLATYAVPSQDAPEALIAGPDGTLWFATNAGIDRMSTSGTMLTPTPVQVGVRQMAADTKTHDVWALDAGSNVVYRIDSDFNVTSISFGCPSCSSEGTDLAVAPDDTAWIVLENAVAGIDASGRVKNYYMPDASPGIYSIAAGGKDQFWIAGFAGTLYEFNPKLYARANLPYDTSDDPSRRTSSVGAARPR
jgi:virginiamycin B lyase